MFLRRKINIDKKRVTSVTLSPVICESGTMLHMFKQKNIEIDFSARHTLDTLFCNQVPCDVHVCVSFVSPAGLGFDDGAILSDIYKHGKKSGLQVINPQAFLSLCLCHDRWHEKEKVTFASTPFYGKDESPLIFSMKTFNCKKIITAEPAYKYLSWNKDNLFVFLES